MRLRRLCTLWLCCSSLFQGLKGLPSWFTNLSQQSLNSEVVAREAAAWGQALPLPRLPLLGPQDPSQRCRTVGSAGTHLCCPPPCPGDTAAHRQPGLLPTCERHGRDRDAGSLQEPQPSLVLPEPVEVEAGRGEPQLQVRVAPGERHQRPGTARAGAPGEVAGHFVVLVFVQVQGADLFYEANLCVATLLEGPTERRRVRRRGGVARAWGGPCLGLGAVSCQPSGVGVLSNTGQDPFQPSLAHKPHIPNPTRVPVPEGRGRQADHTSRHGHCLSLGHWLKSVRRCLSPGA